MNAISPSAHRSGGADLVTAVQKWYPQVARDLPWRSADRTPWGVLVSEVMLQQTPVSRVLPVWRQWLTRWPTPTAFAQAPAADVLRAWGTLGYPRRALRLLECSRTLVEQHNGEVPETEEELAALPGIGEYTAAAVRAFAFGRRAVVVDTNVRRVLARAVRGVALPAPSYSAAERALARALTPAGDESAALWAAASMELGAVVCTARNPLCGDCPVQQLCAWNQAGRPAGDGAPRRVQAWAGTDRQVRGRIMARLRDSGAAVPRHELDLVWSDAVQLDRCLLSLLDDGLVECREDTYALPS